MGRFYLTLYQPSEHGDDSEEYRQYLCETICAVESILELTSG